MIALVSSSASERAAFARVVAAREWLSVDCGSVRELVRLLKSNPPAVVLVRHQLVDGHSDDVISAVADAGRAALTRIIVVMTASAPPADEARQVILGADCVQRDPVRMGVLAEYLAKYHRAPRRTREPKRRSEDAAVPLAGALLHRAKRILVARGKTVALTPREFALADLLAGTRETVTYDTIYSEILGRRFSGDTSNIRVLLAKLVASVAALGLDLRRHVEVLPKLGYRYRQTPPA